MYTVRRVVLESEEQEQAVRKLYLETADKLKDVMADVFCISFLTLLLGKIAGDLHYCNDCGFNREYCTVTLILVVSACGPYL